MHAPLCRGRGRRPADRLLLAKSFILAIGANWPSPAGGARRRLRQHLRRRLGPRYGATSWAPAAPGLAGADGEARGGLEAAAWTSQRGAVGELDMPRAMFGGRPELSSRRFRSSPEAGRARAARGDCMGCRAIARAGDGAAAAAPFWPIVRPRSGESLLLAQASARHRDPRQRESSSACRRARRRPRWQIGFAAQRTLAAADLLSAPPALGPVWLAASHDFRQISASLGHDQYPPKPGSRGFAVCRAEPGASSAPAPPTRPYRHARRNALPERHAR